MAFIIIGHIGSDAGYVYFGPDGKFHRVPGWQVEEMSDLRNAVTALQAAAQIRETGVAESVTKAVMPFVERALAKNLKGEAAEKGIIIIGGATRETAAV